jgi:hypothetical protein
VSARSPSGIFCAAAALLSLAAPLRAHEGPPYPILVDETVAGRLMSVWGDPDVGTGTFYLYLPWEEDAPQDDVVVYMAVQPVDGRLAEVTWPCERAGPRDPYQRIAYAEFDERGAWTVRFLFDTPDGKGDVSTEVDVTPPGLDTFSIIWYLTPFLGIAVFWYKVVQRKRDLEREAREGAPA